MICCNLPECEKKKPSPVAEADAVVDVGTVVIELRHTPVADSAVLGSERAHHPTSVAQTQNVWTPLVFPFVVISYLLDRPIFQWYVIKCINCVKKEFDPHFFHENPHS